MIAQILLADDSTEFTSVMNDYLSAGGHRVIVVNDGFQLAQKAAEHRPHLIISDIQMPGAHGTSAYKVLQNDPKTDKIPVLFVSSHPIEKVKLLLPNDPKTRFLPKPIDFDALEAMMKELLPMGGYVP